MALILQTSTNKALKYNSAVKYWRDNTHEKLTVKQKCHRQAYAKVTEQYCLTVK